MAAQVDLALCLRRLDYSETSQVLVVFTRTLGLVHVIAKGARRTTKDGDSRFSGGIDLLDLGEAVILHSPERELCPLIEWTLVNGHLGLRDSLRTAYLAQYAAELVSLLFQPNDPHPLTFDDLADLAASLAGATDRSGPEELMLAFQLRLLDAAGIMPELAACGHCGTPGEQGCGYFSPSRSSIVCRSCFAGYPDAVQFHPALVRLTLAMRQLCRVRPGDPAPPLLSELKLPSLTRRHTDPVNAVLLAHLAQVTGKLPKVAHYVFAPTGPAARARLTWQQPEKPLESLPPRPLDPEELAAIEARQRAEAEREEIRRQQEAAKAQARQEKEQQRLRKAEEKQRRAEERARVAEERARKSEERKRAAAERRQAKGKAKQAPPPPDGAADAAKAEPTSAAPGPTTASPDT